MEGTKTFRLHNIYLTVAMNNNELKPTKQAVLSSLSTRDISRAE